MFVEEKQNNTSLFIKMDKYQVSLIYIFKKTKINYLFIKISTPYFIINNKPKYYESYFFKVSKLIFNYFSLY